tara:strand:+ start:53 stop:994 length:942 start_codon:yes stop_codon:yes gene_type:complete
MRILVTGCAGFIGSHVCERLLTTTDNEVMGIDNLNAYYDVEIKKRNIKLLEKYDNFTFRKEDICFTTIVDIWRPDKICHLASMAGVRWSIEHPDEYVRVNIGGFINILEGARRVGVKNVVYASSSSVYGLNKLLPFREDDPIEMCNSPYACSKRAMEIFASTYNRLYGISLIGLRFFTVYGPRGRPDMAPYKFMKAVMNGDTIQVYGSGSSSRDYTYISDIVDGILGAIENRKGISCEVYNLGNSSPIKLMDFIGKIEGVVGKKANYEHIEDQLGDVPHTFADVSKAGRDLDYKPKVSLHEGLKRLYDYLSSE